MKQRIRRREPRHNLYKVTIETYVMATSCENAKETLKKSPELADHIDYCGEAQFEFDGRAIELGAYYLAKLWNSAIFTTQITNTPEFVVQIYLQGLGFKFTRDQFDLLYSWIHPRATEIYQDTVARPPDRSHIVIQQGE